MLVFSFLFASFIVDDDDDYNQNELASLSSVFSNFFSNLSCSRDGDAFDRNTS